MFNQNKAYIIFVVFLLALSFFRVALPTSSSMETSTEPFLTKIPLDLGSWQGKDVVLDERTYEILETRNVVSRSYTKGEDKTVHLLLVGSHKDRRVAHPPQVCYVGSGYDIVNTSEGQMRFGETLIPVKAFVAKDKRDPNRQESVLYVYKVGNLLTTNYYTQQILFAWNRLTRNESEILLIRLSGPDRNLFQEFLGLIFPYLS